jgi:glutathione S-transferase
MLEELGEPYEFVEVARRSPEAYALNPSGKVPILIDGGMKITDSAAITVYLADKHAEAGMGANPGLAGRAEIDGWMHFAQSEFEAPLWNKLRHRFILPQELRVDVGPAAAYDFANEVEALDGRLGDRAFALGDRFSAVDVLLGDIGAWAIGGRFRIESERVAAYLDRVLSRPARARAQANGGALSRKPDSHADLAKPRAPTES